MIVYPASASYGIWFKRLDIVGHDPMVQAIYHMVENHAPLCTRVTNADDVSVSTIEHIMAALTGCGVQNALIEIDGPEVPILDGSAAPFVEKIISTGIRTLDAPRHAIEIRKKVVVVQGEAKAWLEPSDTLEMDFAIDFKDAAIGKQRKSLQLANGAFVRELCRARTFCRHADVEKMHSAGLALGGSFENAVVVDGGKVLSPGGLRHSDEAVRHKMLDAMGDLALAGAPILGKYTGVRAGHSLTNQLLRSLFADPNAYRVITCTPDQCRTLPGAGLQETDLAFVA